MPVFYLGTDKVTKCFCFYLVPSWSAWPCLGLMFYVMVSMQQNTSLEELLAVRIVARESRGALSWSFSVRWTPGVCRARRCKRMSEAGENGYQKLTAQGHARQKEGLPEAGGFDRLTATGSVVTLCCTGPKESGLQRTEVPSDCDGGGLSLAIAVSDTWHHCASHFTSVIGKLLVLTSPQRSEVWVNYFARHLEQCWIGCYVLQHTPAPSLRPHSLLKVLAWSSVPLYHCNLAKWEVQRVGHRTRENKEQKWGT